MPRLRRLIGPRYETEAGPRPAAAAILGLMAVAYLPLVLLLVLAEVAWPMPWLQLCRRERRKLARVVSRPLIVGVVTTAANELQTMKTMTTSGRETFVDGEWIMAHVRSRIIARHDHT